MSEAAEKPFDATPQRLERARREGNVARAGELAANCSFAASALALVAALPMLQWCARSAIERAARGAVPVAETAAVLACCLASPAAGAAAAVAANAFQSAGIRFTPLSLKGERLDPVEGCKRMLSRDSLAARSPRRAGVYAGCRRDAARSRACGRDVVGCSGRPSGGCRGLERQRTRRRDRVRYRFALRRGGVRERAIGVAEEAAHDLRRAKTRSEGPGRRSARSRAAPGAASLAAARRDRARARGVVRRRESDPPRDRARIRSARRAGAARPRARRGCRRAARARIRCRVRHSGRRKRCARARAVSRRAAG